MKDRLDIGRYFISARRLAGLKQTHGGWAIFPNPWLSGVAAAEERLRHWETLEEIGALTHEDAANLIAEIPYVGAVPPIRFEFSDGQYKEIAHPAAHFHIGRHNQNRWPSSLCIGPKAFVLIIAKL